MKKVISRFFISGFITLCLASCGGIERFIQRKIEDYTKLPQVTFVLCHGLNDQPKSLNTMKDSLEELFKGSRTIMPGQEDTAKKAINAQSEELFEELERQITDKKTPIVFIAHSQGGLRSYPVAQRFKRKGFKVLMVTLGTPWKGVAPLDKLVNRAKYNQRYDEAIASVKSLPMVQSNIDSYEAAARESHLGLYDMIPNSNFLQGIHQQLTQNKIPILAIGGDVSSLVEPILKENPEWKEPYGNYMMLMDNEPHDLVVQLSSQRAEDISAKNFTRATVCALHMSIPINGLSKLPSELNNPEVIAPIINFVRKKAK